MDKAIPGFVFAAFGRYRRRLYFFIGNIGQDLSHPEAQRSRSFDLARKLYCSI
jgi:hypothetical protein